MTQAGEIRALARLMMVDEKELVDKAQLVQPWLASLDDMGFQTYHFLMGILLAKQSNAEPLPFEPDDEEEETEDDEEWDKDEEPERGTSEWYDWQYRKEQEVKGWAEAMRYRDYCEDKYGWDCS